MQRLARLKITEAGETSPSPFSSHTLTNAQRQVLNKGLGFVPAVWNLPSYESSLWKFSRAVRLQDFLLEPDQEEPTVLPKQPPFKPKSVWMPPPAAPERLQRLARLKVTEWEGCRFPADAAGPSGAIDGTGLAAILRPVCWVKYNYLHTFMLGTFVQVFFLPNCYWPIILPNHYLIND